MSNIWFLLSAGLVAIVTWGNSLPVHARWSDLLFSPGSSWIALQVQLLLVSSSPTKMMQFSFEYSPQSSGTSSVIHHIPILGVWLVIQPLSQLLLLFPIHSWEFVSSPHPHSLGHSQCSTPTPLLVLDFNSQFMLFSFVGAGGGSFNLPWGWSGLWSWGVGRGVMWCIMLTCRVASLLGNFETGWKGEMVWCFS
jgi:hypothetical protein